MTVRLYVFFWLLSVIVMAVGWRWLNALGGANFRYWLGWGGFGIMCLTNLYVLRKNIPALKEVGRTARWLDFHIFCGLVGPTLVVFHTNFRVVGLVAISFWSMMISAFSGIVGRYFYTQLLQQRGQLRGNVKRYDEGFTSLAKLSPAVYTTEAVTAAKGAAVRMAFAGRPLTNLPESLSSILLLSVIGDIHMRLQPLPVPPEMSHPVRVKLKEYGVLQRKLALLDAYKKLMGYWHTFHVPFAVFMYVVAVIHIIAELLFRVHR